jgi:DNA-binding Xre family transcriptional regulator
MDIDTLTRIRTALADRRLDKVALQTGLHENTIRSIASGKNKNPTLSTIERLVAYLFQGK